LTLTVLVLSCESHEETRLIAIRITNMPDGTPIPAGYYLREILSDPVAQSGAIHGGDLNEALLFESEDAAEEFLTDKAQLFPPLQAFGITLETPTLH
jgi:hypothetical protein